MVCEDRGLAKLQAESRIIKRILDMQFKINLLFGIKGYYSKAKIMVEEMPTYRSDLRFPSAPDLQHMLLSMQQPDQDPETYTDPLRRKSVPGILTPKRQQYGRVEMALVPFHHQ